LISLIRKPHPLYPLPLGKGIVCLRGGFAPSF